MTTCPACGVTLTAPPEGNCPTCDFPLQQLRAQVLALYMLLGAMFLSTLAYALLTIVMERATHTGWTPAHFYQSIALVALLGPVGLALARLQAPPTGDPAAARGRLVLESALAEVPAIVGLLGFFLTGERSVFVMLLGLSWLCFLYVAYQVPPVVRAIEQRMVDNFRASKRQ